jgi:hypothetical protein
LTKVTVDNALQDKEFDFVEKISAISDQRSVRLLDVPAAIPEC